MNLNLPRNNAHILIVDDDPDISKLIQFYLDGLEYTLLSVQNGQAGLDELKNKKYDLLLVDRMMPRIDGITFINKIHESGIHKGPVIIMSAFCRHWTDDVLQDVVELPSKSSTAADALKDASIIKALVNIFFICPP